MKYYQQKALDCVLGGIIAPQLLSVARYNIICHLLAMYIHWRHSIDNRMLVFKPKTVTMLHQIKPLPLELIDGPVPQNFLPQKVWSVVSEKVSLVVPMSPLFQEE